MHLADAAFFLTLCVVWYHIWAAKTSTYNVRTFWVAAAVLTGAYFAMAAAFALIDSNGWFAAHKIQRDTCTAPAEYAGVFIRVIIIFALVLLPTLYVFWTVVMPFRRKLGLTFEPKSLLAFVLGTLLLMVTDDVAAWTIHRGLHYFTFLYDNVHVIHHMHVAPVAVAALDAHPVEVVVWDMAPFMIGPLLLGAPVSITLFTTFLAITQTVSAHSGYSFGAASDGNFRDLHHERMKCNYGGDFIMDRMLGTYIAREEGRVYPRWDLAEKSLAGSFNVACSSVRTGAG